MPDTAPTTTNRPRPAGPTPKQLKYLRDLAHRAGQTFAMPKTKGDASREIARLLRATASRTADDRAADRGDRRRERHDISEAIAAGAGKHAAVDLAEEATGWGSSATWKGGRS